MPDAERTAASRADEKSVLHPGACIGILGGGQLGRMMAMAAAQLGFRTAVYSDAEGPAFDVAPLTKLGRYDDPGAVVWLAEHCDVVTYEFENVPVEMAERLAEHRPVRPGPKALAVAQDRSVEKQFMTGCGLPVAPYRAVASIGELEAARADLAGDTILKTRRLGYDGKGQVAIDEAETRAPEAEAVVEQAPCVLEQRLSFAGELSIVLVRALNGDVRAYDAPRNEHGGGILRRSIVPGGFPDGVVDEAKTMARRVADALDYVGVLAVEFFYLPDDPAAPLRINEIAPRVHNSGHWTMDACGCDQFENHVRAVAGWPLGSTARFADAEMTNLIGADVHAWAEIAADPTARLHVYGKRDARDGRKMGHVTRIKGGR